MPYGVANDKSPPVKAQAGRRQSSPFDAGKAVVAPTLESAISKRCPFWHDLRAKVVPCGLVSAMIPPSWAPAELARRFGPEHWRGKLLKETTERVVFPAPVSLSWSVPTVQHRLSWPVVPAVVPGCSGGCWLSCHAGGLGVVIVVPDVAGATVPVWPLRPRLTDLRRRPLTGIVLRLCLARRSGSGRSAAVRVVAALLELCRLLQRFRQWLLFRRLCAARVCARRECEKSAHSPE